MDRVGVEVELFQSKFRRARPSLVLVFRARHLGPAPMFKAPLLLGLILVAKEEEQ